jgi:serine/threonine protein kinase/tetratricopeptide (TPR) repeat protein
MINLSELTAEVRAKIKEILFELSELPTEQRAATLRKRCGQDESVRAAVQSLLEAQDRAGSFLGGPDVSSGTSGGAAVYARPSHQKRIGPYMLGEVIGQGAFGTVYAAEQLQPVRRRVALKILRLGMETEQVIARFEQERQALAIMDHPNIARVFDAGADERSGQPYFVMEFVQGIAITTHCDQHGLDARQRLELFIPVCRAVHHAHQKGVIHRDLKPTNVLVTVQDGQPVPKVIDFGIAKALEARLTEKTVHTEIHQFVGTPQYMSPEQAEGSLDIDTRSDVYSLGALLYELLTGTTPFGLRDLHSRAYAQIQRLIRDVDPPRPSTRLSTIDDQAPMTGAWRAIDRRKLAAMVRGDLDWIVMKCLEKDRSRRYDSAAALAADVQHYLTDEPVAATPPSPAYQLRKFVRRNKLVVVSSAAVIIALIAGITGTTIGLVGQARQRAIADRQRAIAEQQRLEAQRHEADAQRSAREAQQQTAIAQAVSRFQSDMLSSADPSRLLGDKVTVLQAMKAAVKELDSGKLKTQPLVEASVRATIGATLRALGSYDAAEPNLRRALELRRSELPATHPQIAETLTALATLRANQGKYDDAETLFRQALQINRAALPPVEPEIAANLYNLGVLLQERGRGADAEPFFREALDLRRKAFPATHPFTSQSLIGLASVLRDQGKLDDAEPLFREALQSYRISLPPDHPAMVPALSNLAMLLSQQNKLAEAEPLMREALAINRKTLPAGHPDIATALGNLATLLRNKGESAEAEVLCREALEIRRKTLPANHWLIAESLTSLGVLLRDQDKLEESESVSRQALEMKRNSLPAGHSEIARSMVNLAVLLDARGKFAEAEILCRDAVRSYALALGADHWQVGNARMVLGQVLCSSERFREAEAELLQAEQILAHGRGVPPTRRAQCVYTLVSLYSAWAKQEPGKGYDLKSAKWKAELTTLLPATLPTSSPTSASSQAF